MRPTGEAGYVLSLKELVFLASLSGAEEILGIEDDTYLLSPEKLKELWEKIKLQLEIKRYIEVELDGEVIIDKELHGLINVCCRPGAFIRFIGRDRGCRQYSRNYYLSKEIAVELDEDRLMKGMYALTPLTSIEKVACNMREAFETDRSYEDLSAAFSMPASELEILTGLIEKGNQKEAIKIIEEFGCEKEIAEDLLYALKGKNEYASMIIIRLKDGIIENTAACSVISGQKCLWGLNSVTAAHKTEITFNICSPGEAADRLQALVLTLGDIYKSGLEGYDSNEQN